MKKKKQWTFPEILIPELIGLEERQNKADRIYKKIYKDIDPRISYIDAIELIDFGVDPTQYKF